MKRAVIIGLLAGALAATAFNLYPRTGVLQSSNFIETMGSNR